MASDWLNDVTLVGGARGGSVGIRGGGGFVGGVRGGGFVGGVRGSGFRGGFARRGFVRRGYFIGGYGYGYSCWRWRWTPIGYRRVWVCGPYRYYGYY